MIIAFCSSVTNAQTYLYATNEVSSDIWVYSINPASGVLTPIPGSPFPAGSKPQGIAVDPSGRFAFVANQSDNTISAYVINASTGGLIAAPGGPFAANGNPHGVIVAPSGKFLYVSDDNCPSLISAYSIDQNTGALTPITGSPFPAGPLPFFRLSFTPDGRFLYVPNTNGGGAGSVSVFAVNQQTGALTDITGSPFPAGTDTSAVSVDSQGKFAYACSANGVDAVFGFQINALTGELSTLSGSPFPATCSDLFADPFGPFLYTSANSSFLSTSAITAFTINQNSGVLTPIAGSPFSGGQGGGLVVDPTGHFLYGANPNANSVSGFQINQTTGQLTPISGSPFAAGQIPIWLATATPHASSQLGIQFIQPTQGGNAGTVTLEIVGSGFQSGATIALTGLGPNIAATNVNVANPSLLTASFNLTGVPVGPGSIVVTNPSGGSVTLTGGFTVEQGGASSLSLGIIGRNQIRIGAEQSYYIVVGNSGNVDSMLSRIWVAFPTGVMWGTPEQLASAAGQSDGTVFVAFDVSPSAESSVIIPITFQVPNNFSTFQIEAWSQQ